MAMKHSQAESMQARSAGKHGAQAAQKSGGKRGASGNKTARKHETHRPAGERGSASTRQLHTERRSDAGKSSSGRRASAHRRRRSRKNILHSRFYQIYFILLILCVAGVALGMRYLNGVLADYESAQPRYVAQQAAQLFERGDYEAIFGLDSSMQDVDEADRPYYIDQLRSLAAGKEVSWTEAYSADDNERRYRVSLDGEKFAEFTLVPSGAQTEHGNRLWTLGSITTSVRIEEPQIVEPEPTPTPIPAITCSITVPSSFSVTVDGRRLDANDVVEAGIPIVPAGMLPESVEVPTMIRYAFLSETGAPDIQLTDGQGNAQTPVEDGEHSWRCDLPQNPELAAQFGNNVLQVAQRIAKYSTREVSQNSVLKQCAKDSPAYESINSFDSSLGKKPNSSSFENVVVSDFYLYSQDCFSCRVSFDYIPRFGKETKTYPTAYTLYFIRQGSSGKLYSFSLN